MYESNVAFVNNNHNNNSNNNVESSGSTDNFISFIWAINYSNF